MDELKGMRSRIRPVESRRPERSISESAPRVVIDAFSALMQADLIMTKQQRR